MLREFNVSCKEKQKQQVRNACFYKGHGIRTKRKLEGWLDLGQHAGWVDCLPPISL